MKLRKVVGYESYENPPRVLVVMECGHKKPLPRGIYDANTKRLCRECNGTIDRSFFVAVLRNIIGVASGEVQIAQDDTEGMKWIDEYARRILKSI